MFKKIFCFIFISAIFFSGLILAAPAMAAPLAVRADAGPDRNVVVNRPVSFFAGEPKPNTLYTWSFGDGATATGADVQHSYQKTGVFRVKLKVSTTANTTVYSATDEAIIRVDKDLVVLISDKKLDKELFSSLAGIANAKGILLVNIQEESAGLDYIVEKELSNKILLNKEDLRQASEIILWTNKNIGLNALTLAAQELSLNNGHDNLKSFNFSQKYFVVISEQPLADIDSSAQNIYNNLRPQLVVLAKESAQSDIFSNDSLDGLLRQLREKNEEFKLIGVHTQRDTSELKYYNIISYFIGYMVDRGVPLNTIYLLLVLPVIATLVAFSRQIVGFKTLGIYTPSIIAVSFLATGLKFGLIIFLLTLAIGTLGRIIARKVRISYLPRMALVLTLVCLSVFGFFLIGARLENFDILAISIFPILIMVLLTEEFITLEIERGVKSAVILSVETFALTVACYFLASWDMFKSLILGYPEIILLTIVINLLIGRWTGLRLLEYYRFRKVIKNVELAEKK